MPFSAKFQACVAFTLARAQEGGYQQVYADAGNWSGGEVGVGRLIGTNMGISAPTLVSWMRGTLVTAYTMQNLPQPTAMAIYAARYWNVLRGDDLPPGVDLMLFDFAVTSGDSTSAKILQRIVGTTVDGVIGEETLSATNAQSPVSLVPALAAAQGAYYRGLTRFPVFGADWLARTDRRKAEALNMAGLN